MPVTGVITIDLRVIRKFAGGVRCERLRTPVRTGAETLPIRHIDLMDEVAGGGV